MKINKRNKISIFILIVFFFASGVWISNARADSLHIPLTVTESANINRISEPVTSGVPLPEESNILDIANLSIADSNNNQIPAQFKVLSRWGILSDETKPIKWVLVDFQADVDSNQNAVYYLENNVNNAGTGIVVSEDVNKITIDTGALSFDVSKNNFNLFDRVLLNGDTLPIVQSNLDSGLVIVRDPSAPDNNAGNYSSANDVPIVSVEESGPMKTIVLVRGKFKSTGGNNFIGGDARHYNADGRPGSENYPLSYTARITAYKNKSFLKIAYTLENDGNHLTNYYPTNDVFIDGNFLRLNPNVGDNLSVKINNYDDVLSKSENLFLTQTHSIVSTSDESQNFNYNLKKNSSVVSSGARSDGWLDVDDGTRGVTIGMRNFWQNYPKSISWKGGNFDLEILPDHDIVPDATSEFTHFSNGNHWFSGGVHKTTEALIYFHETAGTSPGLIYAAFNNPLFAKAAPSWYSSTKALGVLVERGGTVSANPLQQIALNKFEQYRQIFVDPTKDANNVDIVRLREIRNQGADYYGWRNFGDMAWSGAIYASNHYDWPYMLFNNFVRSGDDRYLQRAIEGVNHTSDIDLIHYYGGYSGIKYDGIWQWEGSTRTPLHQGENSSGYLFSHTWSDGLLNGYFLLGDARYKEDVERISNAAVSAYNNILGSNPLIGIVRNQTRTISWPIKNLLNRYSISGDDAYLNDAMILFSKGLLYTEQSAAYDEATCATCVGSNGNGYITEFAAPYGGEAVVTFVTYPLEPLAELHREAKAAGLDVSALEAYLIRSLNWLKDFAYVGGQADVNGNYSLLTISYNTDPNNSANNVGGTLAHNIHVASAFGYGYLMLKDTNPTLAGQYLDFARKLFKDLMLYKTWNTKTKDFYGNPNVFASVSWGWLPTATKELGYIGRSGQFYLEAERETSADIIAPIAPSGLSVE